MNYCGPKRRVFLKAVYEEKIRVKSKLLMA